MSIDVVRAWKDPEYRKTLTPEELASLPENPLESDQLEDEELDEISGGRKIATETLGGPTRCGTAYPECCYNSTIGPKAL